MGMLPRWFRRGIDEIERPAALPECPHATLTPRWDSAEAMGKSELVSKWVCESCHEEFTPGRAAMRRLIDHHV